MGEVAEDIEDGLRCDECFCFIEGAVAAGAGPGHRQTCSECAPVIAKRKGKRGAQGGKGKGHG
jgi:hypothetical protein